MSWNRLLLCLIVTSLLVPGVMAGTQEDPEVDDGDDAGTDRTCVSITVGPICDNVKGPAQEQEEAEILAVWVSEPDDENYTFHIATQAAATGDTDFTLDFVITPTNTSLYFGSETEIAISVQWSGATAPTDYDNTTVVLNGTVTEITFTRRDTGAVGGDQITDIVVSSDHAATTGSAPNDFTDTTTDAAPDDPATNPSRPFNLSRPPIVPALAIQVLGGQITQMDNGTAETTNFTSNTVTTGGPNATVSFDLVLTNTGTDPDNATVVLFDPAGGLAAANVNVTISPQEVPELLPGESANVTVTATLQDATAKAHSILLQADSGRGAIGAAAMQVTVPAAQPPPNTNTNTNTGGPGNGNNNDDDEEREAAFGLGFLTPMAEAMGLDEPFGDYAELVLLAILLLLLVLVIFLIVFFATRTAIAVEIEPRVLSARPGEQAEFSVAVRNKRGRPLDAVTRFEGDPAWRTGLVFGDAQLTQPDTDAQLGLGPKDRDSGTRIGKLVVTVPPNAHDDETDQVTVAVSALSESGRPTRARSARAKVRAIGGAPPVKHGDLPMRLASVEHVPDEPVAGETVATTARLENDSDGETLDLRVVLNVDGHDVQEQNVVLPPRTARAVVFRWEAPQGSSKVRVRVYPQD